MKTFDVDDIERLSSAIGECRDYMLDALYYVLCCVDDGILFDYDFALQNNGF